MVPPPPPEESPPVPVMITVDPDTVTDTLPAPRNLMSSPFDASNTVPVESSPTTFSVADEMYPESFVKSETLDGPLMVTIPSDEVDVVILLPPENCRVPPLLILMVCESSATTFRVVSVIYPASLVSDEILSL